MTASGPSDGVKKSKRKRGHTKKRRDRKKRVKTKVRLARRLEKYKKIFEQAKAVRAKAVSRFAFDIRVPGELLKISSRVVASSSSARQPPLSPFFINPLQAMSGNCFWMNYQSVFHWKDRHMNDFPATSLDNPSRHQTMHPPTPQFTGFQEAHVKHVGDPQDGEFYMTGSTPESEYYEAEDSLSVGKEENNELNEDVGESDDDIVVTEEMMQFLEISMRHKAKREREKQVAKELARKKQIEDRDTIEDCQVPTEEDENERRLREMSELYGKDAPKIHGMETALQLNFNRQLDLFNPSYWPFYPFSMRFKGVTALK